MPVDPTEYRFKSALVTKRFNDVMAIIQNSSLVGQSIIAYLRNKGYPEVALQFVRDARTRFDLSLECGNLLVASETAKTLDLEDCWAQLAAAALIQGNQEVSLRFCLFFTTVACSWLRWHFSGCMILNDCPFCMQSLAILKN
jgi:coatomer protein complex subunit alpha (xenin)